MSADRLKTNLATKTDVDPATIKVEALETVSIAGKTYREGATFTAPEPSVRDAIARGLLEVADR